MYTGFNLARGLKMLIVALGGIAPIWFIAWIFGFALKKLGGTEKIIYSSLASYVVAIILSGFGNANGGPWNPMILEYALSLIFVIVIRLGIQKLRNKNSSS